MKSIKDFKRHTIEPYPVEKMKPNNVRGTLCSVLRDIHENTDDEQVRLWARIATTMAKKMSARLYWYHEIWKEGKK
jgi:hypothetical protein